MLAAGCLRSFLTKMWMTLTYQQEILQENSCTVDRTLDFSQMTGSGLIILGSVRVRSTFTFLFWRLIYEHRLEALWQCQPLVTLR